MLVPRFFILLSGLLSLYLLTQCAQPPVEKEAPVTVVTEGKRFVLPVLPDTVLFCGSPILINDFDRKERLDKEIIVNTYYHSSTIQYFKRAHRYFGMIEKELKAHQIPEDFKYLCLIESGLAQVTSPAGARGFWQFMPETAKQYGLRVDKEVDERYHIVRSTRAACAYLKDAYAKLGDWSLVAAAYNMGTKGVSDALEAQEVDTYFDLYLNNETSRYVFRILAMKLIFEQQEAYGFNVDELELYEPIGTREVELASTTVNLMHWAREQGTTYRMLKLLNPWILGQKLTVSSEPFILELPE